MQPPPHSYIGLPLIQYTRDWTILGTLVTEIQLWSECIPLHAWLMVRPWCCLGY